MGENIKMEYNTTYCNTKALEQHVTNPQSGKFDSAFNYYSAREGLIRKEAGGSICGARDLKCKWTSLL